MDWIKSWTIRWLSVEKLMLLNYGSGEKSWEFLELQGDQTSQSYRKSVLNVHCKDWCWIWSSKTLATWCRYLTHLKRFWCWEKWKAGGEGDDKGWDSWVASLTQWTWVWASSGSWWLTGKPGKLQSLGSQRVGHDWVTGLNWLIPTIQYLDIRLNYIKLKIWNYFLTSKIRNFIWLNIKIWCLIFSCH